MSKNLKDIIDEGLRQQRELQPGGNGPASIQQTQWQIPVAPSVIDEVSLNPAKWTYERLVQYIKAFEANLDDEHEIGARLVSFGQALTFHINDLGYHGPDIISFSGIDDEGQVVQLIQHTSQLNVLLKAVKKLSDKPRRIGFVLEEKDKME